MESPGGLDLRFMKRVLLISYYFPPCGGAAVQRWLRLIPQLIRAGIGVTVICPKSADYPNLDPSLLAKLPKELKVIRCGRVGLSKTWSRLFPSQSALPYGSLSQQGNESCLRKAMIWIRLNLVIPDMRVLWLPSALKAARAELLKDKYSALITTGPPHSTHLAGLHLRRPSKCMWITDFRDPWLQIHYLKLNPPGALARAFHSYLERKVLATADENLIVSQYIADQLPQGKKTVLYNGFDGEQFKHLNYEPGERFRIKYIGQVTDGQRLDAFIDILEKLSPQIIIELVFIGTKLDDQTRLRLESIQAVNLITKDFLSHQEALQEMVSAELLLLLINDYEGSQGMLTTKLFEYLGSRSPILLLGNTNGEAADLVNKYQSGACFEYAETTQAAEYIERLYTQGKAKRSTADLSEIEASTQVQTLIGLLKN